MNETTETTDLKELAAIKIKVDYYTKLYKEKTEEIKLDMESRNISELNDIDMLLAVTLKPTGRRSFDVDGVREILGDMAKLCIEEVVKPEKFDAIVKKNNKFIITEDQKKKCFSVDSVKALHWKGLDAYKALLQRKVNKNAKTTAQKIGSDDSNSGDPNDPDTESGDINAATTAATTTAVNSITKATATSNTANSE